MIDVTKLNLEKNRRIILISDIHGSLDLFKKLLNKVDYTTDDYLFINGDLCEKGDNSLGVIHYVRQLSSKSERVFVTKGNCDILHRYVFEGHEAILDYMKDGRKSILNEMLEVNDQALDDFHDINDLANYYYKNFKEEIDWLDSLPTAYETEQSIIIHAGLNETLEQTDEKAALTTSSFYEKGHSEQKIVIVGHWPVSNYRINDISSNNPLIDYDKRIIAIDGGNKIKRDGQLNALIIEDDHFSYRFVDSLPYQSYIQRDYTPTQPIKGTVSYPHFEVSIIKEEENFTLCKNISLNIKQWIKNEYLKDRNRDKAKTNEVSTTILSVNANEKVCILDHSCEGYTLIKKENGEVGWVPKSCI
ncbi:metallophosphoesterase [Alkalibacillus haloalkaliphilus]|uniref:Serine/threonine protein phosphatase n=1 Tax=Alkalibacillus haloalkaliphilus TaxID=94136 RepID=A0A511W4W3_9BACI|nr:metallophosphoesterase [Alkalibacillus haloalkaliphilus]GEN46144.1 serine/threonine protein phosphatase [Alkalibacillus haloalkaliphilus]